MKSLLLGATLLLASLLMAQQQGPPYAPPSHGTPPFVGDEDRPPQVPPDAQLPPDTHAPAPSAQPSSEVQRQIQSKMTDEPGLAGANVKVDVTDRGITLTGMVDSDQQHDTALRIAQSYAGDRPIDDKIQVRSKT